MTAKQEAEIRRLPASPSGALTEMLLVELDAEREVSAELFAALKALLPDGWGDDDTMDHMPGVKLARQAIAKAEGRA